VKSKSLQNTPAHKNAPLNPFTAIHSTAFTRRSVYESDTPASTVPVQVGLTDLNKTYSNVTFLLLHAFENVF
jgi:hypothetical protein